VSADAKAANSAGKIQVTGKKNHTPLENEIKKKKKKKNKKKKGRYAQKA